MWADVPDKYFGENRALWWDVKRWAILYYRRYLEKILEFIHYILFKCMHVLNQMGQFFVCKHVTRRQSWGSIQFFLKVFTWKKSLVPRGEKCFCSWLATWLPRRQTAPYLGTEYEVSLQSASLIIIIFVPLHGTLYTFILGPYFYLSNVPFIWARYFFSGVPL